MPSAASSRRHFVARTLASTALLAAARPGDLPAQAAQGFRLGAFSADVTVPAGHGMMGGAGRDTKRQPMEQLVFRSVPMTLEPRNDPVSFTVEGSKKILVPESKPFAQCLAAMNLSWRKRAEAGQPIDVPAVDFGPAQFLLLPAEAYVEFQLHAQKVRRDSFVMVAGYGESPPGYIPIERAWEEKDGNLHDWCWSPPAARPGCTPRLKQHYGSEQPAKQADGRAVSRVLRR